MEPLLPGRYFTRRRAFRVTDAARDVAGSHTQTPSGDTCGSWIAWSASTA